MKQTGQNNRVICRMCKTRYDTGSMTPGMPFSCRHCGSVLYTPGQRPAEKQDMAELPFGQAAVEMGYITTAQLASALKIQHTAGRTRLRLGDILVDKGFLSPKQVTKVLHRQGSRVAFLIPGYEIVEKLGQGGMGAVYKGVHLASRKTVAMKILADRLGKRPEFLERFHREARVAIDLDHPNIVKGFDEGAVGDSHYFVMEYVHGKSAGRVLKKRGHFGERRSMDIARQTGRGLQYAHTRSIVHRDVKPDNLMLTREGNVKLADYGLVKYMDDVNVAGLTTEGQIMGTPNYISPEQAAGKKVIDIRSDIYSLGATLFHMLVGRPPYEGSSVGVIMGMHVSSSVPDPREANPEVSDQAAAIVMKMMAKDLDERYQEPGELLADMDAYFQRKPTRGKQLTPSGPVTPTPAPWDTVTPGVETDAEDEELLESAGQDDAALSRLAPLLLGVGIFLLFTGLAAAAFVVWFMDEEEPPPEPPPPATEPSVRRAETGALANVSNADRRAAALYRTALGMEGEERVTCLRRLVREYPTSELAGPVREELRAHDRKQRSEQAAEREQRRAERDLEATKAYNKAVARMHEGPVAFTEALQSVIEVYPDTQGARLARQRLQRFAAEQKARRAQGAAKDPQAQARREDQRRNEQRARLRFIDAFRQALRTFEWSQALRWAKSLSEDDRYPGLHRLGRDCEADMNALLELYPAVKRSLEGLDREEKVTLVFGTNTKITGRVMGVQEGKVSVLVKGEMVYTRPLTNLSPVETERLFRAGYKAPKPPADLIVALYRFALGDRQAAKTAFDKVHRQDPRRGHHRRMLGWE